VSQAASLSFLLYNNLILLFLIYKLFVSYIVIFRWCNQSFYHFNSFLSRC
jgi:hypothetical protein